MMRRAASRSSAFASSDRTKRAGGSAWASSIRRLINLVFSFMGCSFCGVRQSATLSPAEPDSSPGGGAKGEADQGRGMWASRRMVPMVRRSRPESCQIVSSASSRCRLREKR